MRNPFSLMLLAGVAASAAALVSPALANDWEGFWGGIGGGYGMSDTRFNDSLSALSVSLSATTDGYPSSGGFFTLSAGYDYALLGTLVVGAFVDYDFSGIGSKVSYEIGDQLSVGGRLGYLVAPTTLFFSTFGYAHADGRDSRSTSELLPVASGSLDGYFVGGGVETLIGGGFSLKAEYRYTSLLNERRMTDPDSIFSLSMSGHPRVQSARLSLNYRFGNGKNEPVDNSIPPVTSTWTSPYIGVGAGAGTADTKIGDYGIDASSHWAYDGTFLSFTAGYDYQFNPRFVAGVFGDAIYTHLRYGNSYNVSAEDAAASMRGGNSFDNLLMVGGRLGYLTTPDTLLFVSGGYANAGLSDTHMSVEAGEELQRGFIGRARLSGGFIGAGIETRINDALSLKAEYRYLDFEEKSSRVQDTYGFTPVTLEPAMQLGMVSINWRLNTPSDAAAPLK